MKFSKGILISVLIGISAAVNCGPKYGKCPSGQCCSKYGYCGTTSKHCDAGCQIAFGKCNNSSLHTTTPVSNQKKVATPTSVAVSHNGRCGRQYGKCPSGQCCSKYGYCGTSSNHCATGCQSEFGKCNHSSNHPSTSTLKNSSAPTSINKNIPVSHNGRCGSQYGKCPSGQCCSKYGYCGTSSNHCATGCQSEFGKCNHSSNHPSTSTLKNSSAPTSINKNIPVSHNGRCGSQFGKCPSGQCCSKYGYCGTSNTHCATGCQSEFGVCGNKDQNQKQKQNQNKFKFYSQCINPKHWALSFDDGISTNDYSILDLLKKKGIKATFFLNGINSMDITTSKGKEIVKRIYNDGHLIGSHTWSHKNLKESSKEEIVTEMKKFEEALYKYINKKPNFMRPPYGSGNGDTRIGSILEELGYTAGVMWNVDTMDWDTLGDIDYALNAFKKKLGQSIISLNHNTYQNATKDGVINLIEAEIDFMLKKGYIPVTMDVCLGLEPYRK